MRPFPRSRSRRAARGSPGQAAPSTAEHRQVLARDRPRYAPQRRGAQARIRGTASRAPGPRRAVRISSSTTRWYQRPCLIRPYLAAQSGTHSLRWEQIGLSNCPNLQPFSQLRSLRAGPFQRSSAATRGAGHRLERYRMQVLLPSGGQCLDRSPAMWVRPGPKCPKIAVPHIYREAYWVKRSVG